jgi:hypothetical protein
VEHSKFFSALVKGEYSDSGKNSKGTYEVKVLQFSSKILSAIAHFFDVKELLAKDAISSEELLDLNDAVEFLDVKNAAEFRQAIADRLKETEITAENDRYWLQISKERENFPELRNVALNAIKTNSWENLLTCTKTAATLSNDELLNALETDHPLPNLSVDASRVIYCEQLVKRLNAWLQQIDSRAHFSESRHTVTGKRSGFFKLGRKQLPRVAVTSLNQFAKRAPSFPAKTAETLLSLIEKDILAQPGKVWLQNRFTS